MKDTTRKEQGGWWQYKDRGGGGITRKEGGIGQGWKVQGSLFNILRLNDL